MLFFRFPDVGEGIHEGTVVKILVKEGQAARQDEPLFEVETDKAVVELPCPKAGTVLKVYVKQGDTIKVGQALVAIGEAGEKAPDYPPEESASAKPSEASKQAEAAQQPTQPIQPPATTSIEVAKTGERILATPAVRALAQKLGVDLAKVQGSGPGGRIMPEDLDKTKAYQRMQPAPTPTQPLELPKAKPALEEFQFGGPVEVKPLSPTRKAIAERMTKWLLVPQAGVSDDFDLTKLIEWREKLKREKPDLKVSFLAFTVKATALALKSHPQLNATFLANSGEIAFKKYYNIGIATDTDYGLVVPVVKAADEKKIPQIAGEIEFLATAARERRLRFDDMRDGTFSITNVGSLGGVATSPVISYPQSAILAINKMRDTPVVFEGRITPRKIMRVDLGFDHRVLDGADAMRFLADLKAILENPEKLQDYL